MILNESGNCIIMNKHRYRYYRTTVKGDEVEKQTFRRDAACLLGGPHGNGFHAWTLNIA
jgi:hypothetical protein